MNGHARRTVETVLTLGFTEGLKDLAGKRVFTHPNQPDTKIKIWSGISEGAARTTVDRARLIAGLSTIGLPPVHERERARMKRRDDRAQREAEQRAAEARAVAAGARRAQRARAFAEDCRAREIAALMQPGYGR